LSISHEISLAAEWEIWRRRDSDKELQSCPRGSHRRCDQGRDCDSADANHPAGYRRKIGVPMYIEGMRRDEVIAKLKETEPALKAFGVGALYLFGSHARDEAQGGSDVDVFVDPAPDRAFGFLPFMDAYAAIQKAFGDQVEVGYSTRTGLSPYILEDVEREAVRIF
jgi:predicted nucleotidyltransferase